MGLELPFFYPTMPRKPHPFGIEKKQQQQQQTSATGSATVNNMRQQQAYKTPPPPNRSVSREPSMSMSMRHHNATTSPPTSAPLRTNATALNGRGTSINGDEPKSLSQFNPATIDTHSVHSRSTTIRHGSSPPPLLPPPPAPADFETFRKAMKLEKKMMKRRTKRSVHFVQSFVVGEWRNYYGPSLQSLA
uniref:Uncharacterized protein n=1 Tax=Ditylenchus dipsaci TaxID=166011 RepID=A0A915DF87_9BILA